MSGGHRTSLAAHILNAVILVVVIAACGYSLVISGTVKGRPEQTVIYLCGEMRRAADHLRETNQARIILEEAMSNARCE